MAGAELDLLAAVVLSLLQIVLGWRSKSQLPDSVDP